MEPTVEGEGLIDSNILIDAMQGVVPALDFLEIQQQSFGAKISVITAMELVVGCRDKRELARLQQVLASLTIFPVSPQASRLAYSLMETYRLSHGIDVGDALIAVTAIKRRLVLYTRNLRHFQMIAGLRVVCPY